MKLSVVLIVKNEEVMLGTCLASVVEADEIIVCDTGSIDKTVEIAEAFPGTKVFTDYKWEDSFCKARNHAMSKSTSDWILTIDADETLSVGGIEKIKQTIKDTPAHVLALATYVISTNQCDEFSFPRVYKNSTEVYWKGDVHNHLNVQPGGHTQATVTYGYSPSHALDPDRSLRILQKCVDKNPNKPREVYYLGREYTYKKNWEAAVYYLTRYCEKLATWAPEWADGWYILATAHRALGNMDEAKNAILMALKINMDFKAACILMAELSGPINSAKWLKIAGMATNERVLFNRGMKENADEQPAEYYNKLFAHNSDMSRYLQIHKRIGSWIHDEKVLDIGCGTGELQKFIKNWHGVDFSEEAIRIAANPAAVVGDIYKYDFDGYDMHVCTEVLEHVDDMAVLKRIPIGSPVILSVPSFPDPSHVRTYTEESMRKRFSPYIKIQKLVRFNWHDRWEIGGTETSSYILLIKGRRV